MSQKVRVVMTRTENGCPEGHTVHTYEAGREYDVPEDLAEAFFSMGAADPAEAHQAADETGGEETDAVTGGPVTPVAPIIVGERAPETIVPKRTRKGRA